MYYNRLNIHSLFSHLKNIINNKLEVYLKIMPPFVTLFIYFFKNELQADLQIQVSKQPIFLYKSKSYPIKDYNMGFFKS